MESTALHLEARGKHRVLVGFVDRWSEVGEPTRRARLAQARAFHKLCLLDQALIRLQSLLGERDADPEALLLAGRVYLQRGWISRARESVQRVVAERPDDAAVQALWDSINNPKPPPDERLRDERPESDLDALLPLAEYFLSTGATLKAQAIIEGLRRHHPQHARLDDLAWAVRADWSLGPDTLAELCDNLGPDLKSLTDLADDSEHTESITLEEHPLATDAKDLVTGAFPSLFRPAEGLKVPPEEGHADDDEEEHTHSAGMATQREMLEPPETTADFERTDAMDELGPGDTQILRVIQGPPGADKPPGSGPIHKDIPAPGSAAFNLAEFRREMGMHHAVPGSDFSDLEQEDEHVVVFTSRPSGPADDIPEDPTADALALDPTSSEVGMKVAHLLQASAEASAQPAAPKPNAKPAEAPHPTSPQPSDRKPAASPSAPPASAVPKAPAAPSALANRVPTLPKRPATAPAEPPAESRSLSAGGFVGPWLFVLLLLGMLGACLVALCVLASVLS